MAYNGPVRLILKGDQTVAARYVRFGRVLLWKLAQAALVHGVKSAKRGYDLPDGGRIEVQFAGKLATITIEVGGEGEKRAVIEGFFLTWITDDPDKTPVIFTEPEGEPGSDSYTDWKSSFFNSDAVGFDETPPERRTGSYAGTFGPKVKEPGMRLQHGGGIWINEDEEAVTWFRGYNSGYWPHHWRHPVTNYSGLVSIYGHTVFIVDDPAHRVLAAAAKDNWLYVMVCENLGVLVPPDLPPKPAYSGQVWYSQPFTADTYTYALWRYPISVEVQQDTGVQSYTVDKTKGQKLWTGDLELAYGAWSFNRDCTACVTVQLPRKTVWSWVTELVADIWVASPDEQPEYPEVAAHRMEVTLDFSSDPPTANFSSELAPSLIAEEDGIKLEIVEVADTSFHSRTDYKLGEFQLPVIELFYALVDPEGEETTIVSSMHRRLVFAHLPTKTLLFHRWTTNFLPSRFVNAGYELYVDGEMVPIDDPSAIINQPIGFGATDFQSATNFYGMMYIAYNGSVVHWKRPMDAMSYIYGFNFSVAFGVPGPFQPGDATDPSTGVPGVPHLAYALNGSQYNLHSAAGGYTFGSRGGQPEDQYWAPDSEVAPRYGANNGAYIDDAPTTAPVGSHLGAIAANKDNVMGVTGLQALLGIHTIGEPIEDLYNLAQHFYSIRFGTNGDARALFDAVLGEAPPVGDEVTWKGFTLSYTGKPRKPQRSPFEWP